ncbi:SidC protein [Legionella gratiana]|uniref:SidC protein n=1 Tax=Legionella gratiana TaxID=45066 RepID=A0A378JFJ4_9GAMM|nr:hypothetical protein [Legionella gratiana]KTD06694.1 SidC protein [Legionella gratiana]STX46229.1 SidC protein [Legionella gratiana]
MPKHLKFKEPEACNYVYIDSENRVHLMMPIVAGEGVGTDNTCETGLELRSFFHGFSEEKRKSAIEELELYKKQLEEDILAINTQKELSPLAYKDLLNEKKHRLVQIEEYIKLVELIKQKYDTDGTIAGLDRKFAPELPPGVCKVIENSKNAFAVRLSPDDPDSYTRFDKPLFSLKRNQSRYERHLGGFKRVTEGFVHQFRTKSLEKIKSENKLVKTKTPQEQLIEKVLTQIKDAEHFKVLGNKENFNKLKKLVEQELTELNIDITLNAKKGINGEAANINLEFVSMVLMPDENTELKEWVESLIDNITEPQQWSNLPTKTNIFYEKPDPDYAQIKRDGKEKGEGQAEAEKEKFVSYMSIKTQFLLGQINIYCKSHGLSDQNFGTFFDTETHASKISELIIDALGKSDAIEPIIFNYINENKDALGLSAPLTEVEQEAIIKKFNLDYNEIKTMPHFDEFFVLDQSKTDNMYLHLRRISCHFLDFFTQQTDNAHPLPREFENYSEHLRLKSSSAKLIQTNDIVVNGHNNIERFKLKVLQLLDKKPEALADYLIAKSSSGTPNYSMLSLDTQNPIAFSRHWPMIENQIKTSENISQPEKNYLIRLLDPKNVTKENNIVITWEKHSKKSLLDIELGKIAQGMEDTVTKYNSRKDESRGYRFLKWFKQNTSRKQQCEDLLKISTEIKKLLSNKEISKEEILEKIVKSINTLDRIDKAISGERNWMKSGLQMKIRTFRTDLERLCDSKLNFESDKIQNEISKVHNTQLAQINNEEIREIVKDLPVYCHTDSAINFFKTLSPQEAVKVASYINLHYLDFNGTLNKETLLFRDIPDLFKEKNQALLEQLKTNECITEEIAEKLSDLVDKIRPELFTENNIQVWSTDIKVLEDSKHSELLVTVADAIALIADGERSIKGKLTELEALSIQLEQVKDRNTLPITVQDKLAQFENVTLKEAIRTAKATTLRDTIEYNIPISSDTVTSQAERNNPTGSHQTIQHN